MVVKTFERYFFSARRAGLQLFLVKNLTSRSVWPTCDHRLDLIETDIDRFLARILSPGPTPEMQSCYCSLRSEE